MIWTKLKFGTFVATGAGLILSGSLWYERTDRHVLSRDLVEVWQGANERYWSASYLGVARRYDGWSYWGDDLKVYTNNFRTWTNTSSLTYMDYDSSGSLVELNYMEPVYHEVVTTNYDRALILSLGAKEEQVGYFAFGGYTQYVASGFIDSSYNQTYTFRDRERNNIIWNLDWWDGREYDVVDIFTNDANDHALLISGPDFLCAPYSQPSYRHSPCILIVEDLSGWSDYALVDTTNAYEMLPWKTGYGISVTSNSIVSGAGGIVSNLIWNGTAKDQLFTYSEHHEYEQNGIGRNTYREILEQSATALLYILPSWNETYDYQRSPDVNHYFLNTASTQFVGGVFEVADNLVRDSFPFLTRSNVFEVIGSTNGTPINGAWANAAPRHLRKSDLSERSDVMAQMTHTVSGNSDIGNNDLMWFGDSNRIYTNENGVYWDDGYERTWDEAKALALADLRLVPNSQGYAGAWTEAWSLQEDTGDASTDFHLVQIIAAPFELQSNYVNSNNVCDILYYAKVFAIPLTQRQYTGPDWRNPDPYTYSVEGWEPAVFDHSLLSMTESTFSTNIYIKSFSDFQGTQVVFAVFNTNTPPSVPWCDNPGPIANTYPYDAANTCRGFRLSNFEAVHEWQFEHCTNSINN